MNTRRSELIGRAAADDGRPNPAEWPRQPYFFSERARGVGVYWPSGAKWFANDPLPPSPHSHPGASEIYYVAGGRLELTVGRTEVEMSEGDLCLIPKGTFHHPRGTRGVDLFLWCVVAPNWRGRRWKRSDFNDAEMSGVPRIEKVSAPGPLPSDDLLQNCCMELAHGEVEQSAGRPGTEHALYILEGSAEVTVGRLSGRLECHEHIHVPSGAYHRVVNVGVGRLRFLSTYMIDPLGLGIADELGVARKDTY